MASFPNPASNARLGFHYYPDTLHYREFDLNTWLPELSDLGAAWLTLPAPLERAIPEYFLNGLLSAGIKPVLQFDMSLQTPPSPDDLRVLFRAYAREGVQYICLFDSPNQRSKWSTAAWAQADLVERFLDIYLPLADVVLQEGLVPVFPPLEPGGDYWDTSFLRAALRGIQRRGKSRLIDALVLGAYAWSGYRSLDWGSGGPACWPASRPYFTPPDSQDQRGFHIFDWYMAFTQAEFGSTRPVLILAAGLHPKGQTALPSVTNEAEVHALKNLEMVRALLGDPSPKNPTKEATLASQAEIPCSLPSTAADDQSVEPIPQEVLACNFWLLVAAAGSCYASQAWFQPDGTPLPVVGALRQWLINRRSPSLSTEDREVTLTTEAKARSGPALSRPIPHYLLLPLYAWGAADWQLEALHPFIQKYHPTVGFSLVEAALAERVTVIGGAQSFPDSALERLRATGCRVERIQGDGTSIATQLSAL